MADNVMNAPRDTGLMRRAVHAVGWGYGGTVARMALQVVAQAVLARLLGPGEFGVYSALMLSAAVAVIAADWTSAPVIQARQLDSSTMSFAFGCQVCGASLLVVALLASLPVYERLFPGVPGLTLGVCLMSAGGLLTSISGLSLSLLRRSLRYREIQLAQIAGYFVGYVVVAIPLAWLGVRTFHVLALAWVVQSAVNAAMLFRAAPHALVPSFRFGEHREFWRFGLQITLGNLGNWFAGSCDRLLVAKTASAPDIGLYNTILNLAMTPVTQLAASLNTVAFSVSSQAGDERRRSGAVAYLNLTALVAAVLYGFIATFPESFVTLLYGRHWRDGADFVMPFCIAAVAFAVGAAANAVLTSTGRGTAVAAVQVAAAVAVLVGVAIALHFSLLAAAFVLATVYALRAFSMTILALKSVGGRYSSVIRLLAVPISLTVAQVAISRQFAQASGWDSTFSDIFLALVGVAVSIVLTYSFRRIFLSPEAQDVLIGIYRQVSLRLRSKRT